MFQVDLMVTGLDTVGRIQFSLNNPATRLAKFQDPKSVYIGNENGYGESNQYSIDNRVLLVLSNTSTVLAVQYTNTSRG